MQWFKQLQQIFNKPAVVEEHITAEVAVAVFLFEVMKMDELITSDEEKFLYSRLMHHFDKTEDEVRLLAVEAKKQLEKSVDYHEFTRSINAQMNNADKVELIESLWLMALSDGKITADEHHMIRKISDLLHLRHSEYVDAKTRAMKTVKNQE